MDTTPSTYLVLLTTYYIPSPVDLSWSLSCAFFHFAGTVLHCIIIGPRVATAPPFPEGLKADPEPRRPAPGFSLDDDSSILRPSRKLFSHFLGAKTPTHAHATHIHAHDSPSLSSSSSFPFDSSSTSTTTIISALFKPLLFFGIFRFILAPYQLTFTLLLSILSYLTLIIRRPRALDCRIFPASCANRNPTSTRLDSSSNPSYLRSYPSAYSRYT